MRHAEIKRKLALIVAMTQLDNFIHLPMLTYSAGMFARLSFAVSAAIEPDILLMDEGFGAGDAGFVEKKMRCSLTQLNKESILVVASHDICLIDGDATGIENIFLLGRTLGMRHAEIKRKLALIVAMTQLDNFIHLPMLTYSAGMFARLSFAVSAAIERTFCLWTKGLARETPAL